MSQPTNFGASNLCGKYDVGASGSETEEFSKGTSMPILLVEGFSPVLAYISSNRIPNTQTQDKVTPNCKSPL